MGLLLMIAHGKESQAGWCTRFTRRWTSGLRASSERYSLRTEGQPGNQKRTTRYLSRSWRPERKIQSGGRDVRLLGVLGSFTLQKGSAGTIDAILHCQSVAMFVRLAVSRAVHKPGLERAQDWLRPALPVHRKKYGRKLASRAKVRFEISISRWIQIATRASHLSVAARRGFPSLRRSTEPVGEGQRPSRLFSHRAT